VLRKAANAFDELRKRHGAETCCRDVYVKAPANSPTTSWFVGKLAFDPTITGGDDGDENGDKDEIAAKLPVWAAIAQKRLILEYASNELRPQNLGGPTNSKGLELWLAPGDSEMDIVQNKVALEPVTGSAADVPAWLPLSSIGYNPEIYVGDERTDGGLRVERDERGQPIKPAFDVNQSI